MNSKVSEILNKHWDGKIPVDPYQICNSMGIRVIGTDFNDDTICTAGLKDGQMCVFLSKEVHKNNPVQSRWAVAHSLGHIILHKD